MLSQRGPHTPANARCTSLSAHPLSGPVFSGRSEYEEALRRGTESPRILTGRCGPWWGITWGGTEGGKKYNFGKVMRRIKRSVTLPPTSYMSACLCPIRSPFSLYCRTFGLVPMKGAIFRMALSTLVLRTWPGYPAFLKRWQKSTVANNQPSMVVQRRRKRHNCEKITPNLHVSARQECALGSVSIMGIAAYCGLRRLSNTPVTNTLVG